MDWIRIDKEISAELTKQFGIIESIIKREIELNNNMELKISRYDQLKKEGEYRNASEYKKRLSMTRYLIYCHVYQSGTDEQWEYFKQYY